MPLRKINARTRKGRAMVEVIRVRWDFLNNSEGLH